MKFDEMPYCIVIISHRCRGYIIFIGLICMLGSALGQCESINMYRSNAVSCSIAPKTVFLPQSIFCGDIIALFEWPFT